MRTDRLLSCKFCYVDENENELICIVFRFENGDIIEYMFTTNTLVMTKSGDDDTISYRFLAKGVKKALEYFEKYVIDDSFNTIESAFARKLMEYV